MGVISAGIPIDILQIRDKVEFPRFFRTSLLSTTSISTLFPPSTDSRELGFFFTYRNWLSTGSVDQ